MNENKNEDQKPAETETTTETPAPIQSDVVPARKPRGFAAISPERRAEIASKGGRAAHARGTAHRFTAEEASAAGKKGGSAPHTSRGPQKKTG